MHAERYPPYKWTIKSSEYVGLVNTGGLVYWDKDTATKKGEKITITVSDSRAGGITGELKVSYSVITAKLGFGYKSSFKTEKSKQTKSLKKGETVRSYYQKRNKKYKVVQQGRSTGRPILTRTVYVYKPFSPTITFKYS